MRKNSNCLMISSVFQEPANVICYCKCVMSWGVFNLHKFIGRSKLKIISDKSQLSFLILLIIFYFSKVHIIITNQSYQNLIKSTPDWLLKYKTLINQLINKLQWQKTTKDWSKIHYNKCLLLKGSKKFLLTRTKNLT